MVEVLRGAGEACGPGTVLGRRRCVREEEQTINVSFLGIKTGKCVMFNNTHSTCEIYSWCPVESSTLPR